MTNHFLCLFDKDNNINAILLRLRYEFILPTHLTSHRLFTVTITLNRTVGLFFEFGGEVGNVEVHAAENEQEANDCHEVGDAALEFVAERV